MIAHLHCNVFPPNLSQHDKQVPSFKIWFDLYTFLIKCLRLSHDLFIPINVSVKEPGGRVKSFFDFLEGEGMLTELVQTLFHTGPNLFKVVQT